MSNKIKFFKSWSSLLSISFLMLILSGCYIYDKGLSAPIDISEEREALLPPTLDVVPNKIVSLTSGETALAHSIDNRDGETVTLSKVAQIVVASHPKIRQAQELAHSEEAFIDVAKSGYLPKVSGGLGMRYDHNVNSQGDKKSQPTVDVEVSQTLYDFGQTASAVKSARSGHLSAVANRAKVDEELIYTATSSAVLIGALETQMHLAGEQVREVATLVRLVEERHEKGASNLSDLLQAKSRLNDVKSQQLNIQSQYQSELSSLALMLGLPSIRNVDLSQIPQGLYQSCNIIPSWSQIPDYAIASYEIERALADADYAGAERLPTVDLRGNYTRRLDDSSRRISQAKDETRVSVNLSIPLYEGGRLNANKRQALSRVQMAKAERDEIRLEVSRLISDAKVRINNRMNREQLLYQRVENLQGTKELYRKQYLDLGTRTLLDLLNSEQEYHAARVEAENNKLEIIQAALDCAYYKGELRTYFNLSR